MASFVCTGKPRGGRVHNTTRISGVGMTPAEYKAAYFKPSVTVQQLMTVRPKPVVQVTYSNGHKVINLVRLPEVVQVLKHR